MSADEKLSSNGFIAMDVDELISLTIINRVKSDQAIRRSRTLVKGTKNLIERPMHALAPPVNGASDSSRTMEVVRQEARNARERSRQAIEQSKATRGRQVALKTRLFSQRAEVNMWPGRTARAEIVRGKCEHEGHDVEG